MGGGRRFDIAIYGQESNPTTWRLCKMNLAIRGIEGDLGPHNADSFFNDLHKDLRADFILANPPFNMSAWGGEQLESDVRWQFGVPPKNNANFAWVQHMIHHLAPNGRAGFVLANGSMSSMTGGEGEIRKGMVEADLVDCMVALPGQLFYTTQIPVCLWFLDRNKRVGADPRVRPDPNDRPVPHTRPQRDRRGETLFIDARELGTMISRTQRELTEEDIEKIAGTYHAWRMEIGRPDAETRKEGDAENGVDTGIGADMGVGADTGVRPNEDVAGFCKSATIDEIREHNYVLTPGRYVGFADLYDDDEQFEDKISHLTGLLKNQFADSEMLTAKIRASLGLFGYEIT